MTSREPPVPPRGDTTDILDAVREDYDDHGRPVGGSRRDYGGREHDDRAADDRWDRGWEPEDRASHQSGDSDTTRVAVIYYSATASVYAMAQAVAAGAADAGATVRLRRVRETAGPESVAANPAWAEHFRATEGVAIAELADVAWADAVIFGTPTRFGNVSAQLKAFIDTLGPLWGQGRLVNKVFAGFTSSATAHGGQEATLLALYASVYHFGGIVVAPGYADPVQFEAGNPYGASHTSDNGRVPPGEIELAASRFTGYRAASVASALRVGRSELD